ncbi:MAG TPA: glycosyltransferase family 4 protein [Polyangiaceae bacterium]|nr:glycosyltransferase family 4 protein [Polyangiaceae bacterium]
MRTLILAAGRFGEQLRRDIAKGREPRLDVFELSNVLRADVIDFLDVERSNQKRVKLTQKSLGYSAAVAYLGFLERKNYDAILTSGEDIGLPLCALLARSSARCSHTMIAHTLFPRKKRVFFQYLNAATRLDRILVYSTSEEQLVTGELGVPRMKVKRIHYHADQQFFRPVERPVEPDLICAAGQLLRDYDCLVEAVRDLPVRVQIAAGSPWIERKLEPQKPLPGNVSWGKLNRFDLRDLYERAAVAVVPILENHYQTGIATILEMMAMGKCVIATRTQGQTDTIVDGQTGIYVPPSDPVALRTQIQRVLRNPDEAQRIGQAARKFVEEHAGLDQFVTAIAAAVREGFEARASSS